MAEREGDCQRLNTRLGVRVWLAGNDRSQIDTIGSRRWFTQQSRTSPSELSLESLIRGEQAKEQSSLRHRLLAAKLLTGIMTLNQP